MFEDIIFSMFSSQYCLCKPICTQFKCKLQKFTSRHYGPSLELQPIAFATPKHNSLSLREFLQNIGKDYYNIHIKGNPKINQITAH